MSAPTRPRSSTPEERRLTARGAATRARIVAAAGDLIYLHGVGATSLDEVMVASATSKSQLYHYFADKDALVLEVIALQTARVLATHEPFLPDVDSLAGLRRWCDAVIALNRNTGGVGGCPLGSLASELAEQSEHARRLLVTSFQAWESRLAAGLEAMRQQGVLNDEVDPQGLATAVMSALQGGLLMAQTARSARPLILAMDMAYAHVAGAASPTFQP